MLSEQMLSRIEYIHKKGYIHRDIKPSNFVIGKNEKRGIIYIIDFGLAKKYIKNSSNYEIYKNNNIIGTLKYASIRAHFGFELSWKDDLESLCYCILYFLEGKLPWEKKELSVEDILNIKINLKSWIKIIDIPNELYKFYIYVKGLKYDEKPNYEYLHNLLKELGEKIKIEFDNKFDWIERKNGK